MHVSFVDPQCELCIFFASASKIVTRRWEEMKGLYHFGMTKKILKLLKRHKEQIYTNHPLIKRRSSVATSSEGSVSSNGSVTPNEGVRNSASMPCLSEERDSNGFPVDPDKIVLPDDRMWTANSFAELDEYYTRYKQPACVCNQIQWNLGTLNFWDSCVRDTSV